jgi:hypothetical protein
MKPNEGRDSHWEHPMTGMSGATENTGPDNQGALMVGDGAS